jgi:3-oxoadipate enol-lactonase
MSAPLTHRVDGTGETVLLLNGGMMSISAWDDVAATLSPRYRVVRCDFRGQLLTPELPPPELSAHVNDVVALLDHLGLDRVHAVGTSFGGEVALLLAAHHPERVCSLVAATVVDFPPPSMRAADDRLIALCESAIATGDPRPFFAAMNEIIYSRAYRERVGTELLARYEALTTLPAAWFAGGVRLLAAVNAVDLTEPLRLISCPALVIAAELDELMPMERTVAVARAIRGAELVVVPGSGHALVVERKDHFIRLLAAFLARNTGDPGSVLRSP